MKQTIQFVAALHRSPVDLKMSAPADFPSYIHLVQHLIEKCLLFNMDQQECADALSKHANIQPTITITVWNELEKENKEFFTKYNEKRGEHPTQELKRMLDDTTVRFYKQNL